MREDPPVACYNPGDPNPRSGPRRPHWWFLAGPVAARVVPGRDADPHRAALVPRRVRVHGHGAGPRPPGAQPGLPGVPPG